MKIHEIFDELKEVARQKGITVRRDQGRFRSGYCILNEKRVVLFNRTTPLEMQSSVLARCLINENIDDIYVKPVIREYIDKEKNTGKKENDFNLKIEL